MNRVIRLLCSVVLLVILAPSVAFSAPPKGAVKLAKSKLVQKDGFFCGNIKGWTWVPGRRIPGGYFYSYQAERTNLRGQLKRASKKNRSKIRAQIDALTSLMAERSAACATAGGGATGGKRALRFDFTGAVGLTLNQATGAAGLLSGQSDSKSNLKKIDGAGNQSPAVTSGSATISKFLIAPNDKLYVLFTSGTNLNNTSQTGRCLLAEVDKSTGVPLCIEDEIDSVLWLSDNPNAGSIANKSIQFDASGAIYYLGRNARGTTSLRKNVGGSKSDLINDNIMLYDFMVLADGSVIASGQTTSTQAFWLRRISPQGGLQTLATTTPKFLRGFPDGNIYIGSGNGVKRYVTTMSAIEDKYWISTGFLGEERYCDAGPICQNFQNIPFCLGAGSSVKGLHRTTDGKMFAVAGLMANGQLVQYYPALAIPSVSVSKVTVAQGVFTNIILTGLNSANRNVLTLFNTTDQSELELIGAANEIEIYHLNYVASTNRIMFDGLRFSDNKYVIGQYDLNTMTFSASQTGSTKLVDFQTF